MHIRFFYTVQFISSYTTMVHFLGLVFFKETPDDGYALICGPGGSYNPPHGDLEGFCNDVSYVNFRHSEIYFL